MPTYEYQCRTCGHRFEYMQSISAEALKHCPASECAMEAESEKGQGEVKRLVSGGAGLVFKGEGFYLTDYVRKGGDTSGSTGGTSSSATSSSGNSSSGSSGSSTSTSSSDSGSSSKSTSGSKSQGTE